MSKFEVYRKQIADYTGREFLDNFERICANLYTELKVLTFAFILYDENAPEFRQLLRDPDYWDALDAASGDHMVVFTLSDKRKTKLHYEVRMLTEFTGSSQSPGKSYSEVMKTLFDSDSPPVFPSVLFFQVTDGVISDYRLVPLRRRTVYESFRAIQDLFQAMSNVLNGVAPQFYGNQKEIFQLIRAELLNRDFTMRILRGPRMLIDLIGQIKKIAGVIP